jgi:hypothetical protein
MATILTTNGSRPMVPAPSPTTSGSHPMLPAPTPAISGSHPLIPAKPVINPMSAIANDVRNSLYGTGSFGSNNVHIQSIQSNISRALSVSNEFANKPAQASLQAAQQSLAQAASAKDAASRYAALAAARQYMIMANNEMSAIGYGKPISQTTTSTPKPMITTSQVNKRVYL